MLLTADHLKYAEGAHALPSCFSPAKAAASPAPQLEERIRVALFCGGRGSASIARELVRWPQVDLSLLVNAYDDGLSTGELRGLIPTMLGPSDFRKNLSRLLDPSFSGQNALRQILEFRLPLDFGPAQLEELKRYAARPASDRHLRPELRVFFRDLDRDLRREIAAFLKRFFDFCDASGIHPNLAGYSFGNLIFAGCYLAGNEDFNGAVERLARLFRAQARLINVSGGENRTLAALKADGRILTRESEIVGPQSDAPILDFYLLPHPLDAGELRELDSLTLAGKRAMLERRSRAVEISAEAETALMGADVILYGPGTQYSSLLPSYRIAAAAIRRSPAQAKILVLNLDADADTQSLTGEDLLDRVLETAGDPANSNGVVTHVLVDEGSLLRFTREGHVPKTHKNTLLLRGRFANPVRPQVHSGYAVVHKAMEIRRSAAVRPTAESLEIYVDLVKGYQAAGYLAEEFQELPWDEQFSSVRLRLNRMPKPDLALPSRMEIQPADYSGAFTDSQAVSDWLRHGTSDYLVTITGDGEYRMSDVLLGIQVLRFGVFGAVYGSRTQSQKQFRSALQSAYARRPFLYALSWLGAFLFTAVLGLRFRVILSDPLTGFRVYRRSHLNASFRAALEGGRWPTPAGITRLLIRNSVEIAEIPVTYRTYPHFTNPVPRLWRGLRNLASILGG